MGSVGNIHFTLLFLQLTTAYMIFQKMKLKRDVMPMVLNWEGLEPLARGAQTLWKSGRILPLMINFYIVCLGLPCFILIEHSLKCIGSNFILKCKEDMEKRTNS